MEPNPLRSSIFCSLLILTVSCFCSCNFNTYSSVNTSSPTSSTAIEPAASTPKTQTPKAPNSSGSNHNPVPSPTTPKTPPPPKPPATPRPALPTPVPTAVSTLAPLPNTPSNSSDPFDKSNSRFPIDCNYYLNFVKTNFGKSVPVPNDKPTPFYQYDCTYNAIPRCGTGDGGLWDGDWNWVWNKVIESNTDPYRYAVIWFMQLIGDSDDLFHECDDDPKKVPLSALATTQLNLKPDCMTLGKWCRAWTGNVLNKTPIEILYQGNKTKYSVEDAFMFLSKNRIKIDFKDETIDKSVLRNMTADEQRYLVYQWKTNNQNCISDQHYCYECNWDPNHCKVADGCLYYGGWCP